MDTISVGTEAGSRASCGGKRGSYRTHSVEEKRRIVEECLTSGASVAKIARRHEMNANQLFGWRKLYLEGGLGAVAAPTPTAALLAVRVNEPSEHEPRAVARAVDAGWIEISVGRYRVRMHGAVDRVALATVLEVLASR